eukprot:3123174-Lingulodinium_polyedra.AAC.1
MVAHRACRQRVSLVAPQPVGDGGLARDRPRVRGNRSEHEESRILQLLLPEGVLLHACSVHPVPRRVLLKALGLD